MDGQEFSGGSNETPSTHTVDINSYANLNKLLETPSHENEHLERGSIASFRSTEHVLNMAKEVGEKKQIL